MIFALASAKFDISSVITLVAILFLFFVSYLMSIVETTYSSVNELRMKSMAEENKKGARKAYWVVKNFDKAINSILVTNTIADVLNTTLCAYLLGTLIADPTLSNIITTLIMSTIIISFCGIIPKVLAKIKSEEYALKLSGFMVVLIKTAMPLVWFFDKFQKLFTGKAKKHADENASPSVTEDELGSIIDTMEEEGVIDGQMSDIIQGAIDLGAKTVYDIMTPRINVVAISVDASEEEIKQLFALEEYSRIPVYQGDKDNMIGVIYQKDFFRNLIQNKNIPLKDMLVQPLFVVENMKLKTLIKNMRYEKKHLAVVVDEHGGTSGIVTLEDAIEEVVGDIYDEQDDAFATEAIKQIKDNVYEVSADITVSELYEHLDIENLPDDSHSQLGVFLYELTEHMPRLRQKFEVVAIDDFINDDGEVKSKKLKLVFEVIKVVDKRINRVVLTVSEFPIDEK